MLLLDEKGNPLDEPVAPSALPIYAQATKLGCSNLTLEDLRQYIG